MVEAMGVLDDLPAGLASLWLRYRRRLYHSRPFMHFARMWGRPAYRHPAGWVTTEAGRQPWVVYGLLRTRDAVSAHSTFADEHQFAGLLCGLFPSLGCLYLYEIRLIQ